MSEIYEKIVKTLKENNVEYQEHHHEPVRTSEEAAKVRNSKLSEGAKALIFTTGTGYIMAVVPGDERVNTDAMKINYGFNKLKMTSPEEAQQVSGAEVGGVPPFGNLFVNPIPVYAEKSLLNNEYIEFNAGDRSISIRMKASDWKNLVNPILMQNNAN